MCSDAKGMGNHIFDIDTAKGNTENVKCPIASRFDTLPAFSFLLPTHTGGKFLLSNTPPPENTPKEKSDTRGAGSGHCMLAALPLSWFAE